MLHSQAVAYLSGSPRVSTRANVETTGARAHVLGVMHAMESLGLRVRPYIVGDKVPESWVRPGSARSISRQWHRRAAADAVRLILASRHRRAAWKQLRGQVDWVYERFGAFQAMGARFQRHGTPWVLETNGPLFIEAAADRKSMALTSLARRMELAAYHRCDALVCISQELKDLIVHRAGLPPDKVIVVPNGVDTSQFDAACVQPRRRFEAFTIGFVGNMYPWAGLDRLILAVRRLRDEGLDVKVTLVGDGMARHDLEAQVRELMLGEHVCFTGRLAWTDVPAHMAGFDVAFSGQVRLSMGQMYHSPLKLYEYLAMGRPVVASAFDQTRQTLADNETGFLYPPEDQAGLEEALRRAFAAREQLPDMGAEARRQAVARHSWQARVQGLLDQLQPRLARSAAGSQSASMPVKAGGVTEP